MYRRSLGEVEFAGFGASVHTVFLGAAEKGRTATTLRTGAKGRATRTTLRNIYHQ
jgi:hypothetical protein